MKIFSAPVMCAIAVSTVVCAWFITYGTWRLFEAEDFGSFYDDQARSLLQGHWDVTYPSINNEAFVVKGKFYGYFGVVPALPRMVLNLAMPAMYGRWSRLSMLTGVLLAAIAALLCLQAVSDSPPEPLSAALFVLIATLGSSIVFLASKPYIYHEAILWASVLALFAYLCFTYYLRTASVAKLAWGCVFSAGAFFARSSTGTGTIACILLLLAGLIVRGVSGRKRRLLRGGALLDWLGFPSPSGPLHAAVLGTAFSAILLTYVWINHSKFGTILDSVPIRYSIQYTPDRLARTHGRLLNFSNLPFGFKTYILNRDVGFRGSFPWLTLTLTLPKWDRNRVVVDYAEPYAALPWAMPALCLLSVLGITALIREGSGWRYLLPILLASGSCFLLLFALTIFSYRYEHDVYPFLIFSSAVGLSSIARWSNPLLRRFTYVVIVVAGLWSVYANCAFAITYQRELCWGVDEKQKASFREFREGVDERVRRLRAVW